MKSEFMLLAELHPILKDERGSSLFVSLVVSMSVEETEHKLCVHMKL